MLVQPWRLEHKRWQWAQCQVGIANQNGTVVNTRLVNVCAKQVPSLNSIVCRFVRSPAADNFQQLLVDRFFFGIGEATGSIATQTEIQNGKVPQWRLANVRTYSINIVSICLIQCWGSSASNGNKSDSFIFCLLLASLIHAARKLRADETISRQLSPNWVN